MLQFVTCPYSPMPEVDQVKAAIEGGCRWVQINMRDASNDKIREVVEAIKPECEEKEVFLILASNVELAKELNVGGVHLYRGDMPCSKARMILGPAAVIGVTAESYADVVAVSNLDIDYYALYPYADSDGYSLSNNVLGFFGTHDICHEMEKDKINIPRVAMGGIYMSNLSTVLASGVNGIAVSEAIAKAYNPVQATRDFISALPMNE